LGMKDKMTVIVDFEKARLGMAVRRGFRNWKSQFGEAFGPETYLSGISAKTIELLAAGKDRSTFYILDLIMNLRNMGSGFEFNDLHSKEKMAVMDCYLFVLDRIRFEYMKRMGWLEGYPGEEFTLTEMILHFDQLGPRLQALTPALSRDHSDYDEFRSMNPFEREEWIRKLIPKALRQIQDHSTTL
jgi:hypothetical protein